MMFSSSQIVERENPYKMFWVMALSFTVILVVLPLSAQADNLTKEQFRSMIGRLNQADDSLIVSGQTLGWMEEACATLAKRISNKYGSISILDQPALSRSVSKCLLFEDAQKKMNEKFSKQKIY